MFLIENGRSQFFQWDIKQRLIVEDASIEQVHFCNRTDDCSLKREVYNEGGKRIVNVPDILLQDNWRIHVYAWDKNYTKYEEVFEVVKRTKPANYVYTEEEITEFEDLEKRLDEIEKNGVSDERIAEGVAAYLAENPVEAGATAKQAAQIEDNKAAIAELQVEAANHATTAYVDNAIANAQIGGGGSGGEIDLTNYYTKAQTDSRIAEAVESVPQADLDNYYTKSEVDNAIAAEKKVIHGYMDDADVNGETITFDMTAAEMYALGNDLLNYDVILRVGNIYAYTLSIVQTVPNQFVRMTFTATRTDRINYYDIYIRPNGTFDTDNNGEQATVIYEVPSTQGCLPSKTYNLVVQNNQYTLVEQGTAEELPIAMIMAEDVAGQLYQEKPATLENIIAMYGEEALFTLKLVVANEAEAEATIYSIFEVNMAEQTLIFTNGADKQVILNADGSLSYCDITNYATVNQVNTLISEALGVIENGSY